MGNVQCTKCKKAVPAGEVTFIDAQTYVCHDCGDAIKGKLQSPALEPKSFDATPTQHVDMKCGECGFVNKVRPEKVESPVCGYCGSDNVMVNIEAAAALLSESEESTAQ